ncbi:pyridoxamine 5'-phosphate oxidase family protein [Candidatus Bathyarchaeota archaeon]|nr:pyridoxamine 5'-phosphate oxidase family protein [Candidatus Bathyarchaeota archaeon]
MEKLDFGKLMDEKVKFFEDHHTLVLSTCSEGLVTARTVTYSSDGMVFYVMSWDHHEKILQIKKNPQVALARDNISMKGIAEILGPLTDEKSKVGVEVTRKKRSRELENYGRIPGMIMFKVEPYYVKSWVQIDRRFYIEHMDLKNKTAWLEKPEEPHASI